MVRYSMTINLRKCIGCYSCALACKVENGTPMGIFLTKVLEQEEGTYPNAKRIFVPVLCNHCENPACLGDLRKSGVCRDERPILTC